ncbi:phospholipase D family protein [Shewanella maritima]|uniref:phospholipase D family protein n=1 Tax=Shewanella maritima TaxID=2520507 RepID=UPI0037354BE2
MKRSNNFILLIIVSVVIQACTLSYPDIDDDFEQQWTAATYQANAYVIPSAPEALATRITMIREANATIDMTYFSWDKDTVGLVLMNELLIAAERGVKVRLTLDDLLVFNENWLASVASHPNIQIKIFNPFKSRKSGWAGRIFDFAIHQKKLDHRLHEKYFNVDHQQMILGGRNIGDAYFGFSQKGNFFDMDVLFTGELISAFADNYEQLWQGDYAVPIDELIMIKQPGYDEFYHELTKVLNQNQPVVDAIYHAVANLVDAELIAVHATPIFDSVAKLTNNKPYFRSRLEHEASIHLTDASSVTISTPYAIKDEHYFSTISKLAAQQTEVTLVTNSAKSNDSAFIPAYYEQYREELLDKQVNIFEYKANAENKDHFYHEQTYYHNKAVIIDEQVSYVGSSNFDPRSDYLNIEFGVLIESAKIAKAINSYIFEQKDLLWQVKRDSEAKTFWQSDDEIIYDSPDYHSMHKLPDWVLRHLRLSIEL